MASEKQAQLAARNLSPTLKKRRAFAVDVRKMPRGSGYAVYVYFETPPDPALPPSTTVTVGRRAVKVPVRVVVTERFRPD
jgi:hypothetical protein